MITSFEMYAKIHNIYGTLIIMWLLEWEINKQDELPLIKKCFLIFHQPLVCAHDFIMQNNPLHIKALIAQLSFIS